MTPYLQLQANVEFELEEKRSRFMCFLYPVVSREQALSCVDALRNSFPDARHHCWAYVVGNPQQPQAQAYSDDGEPAGTAGKPILNVLTQRGAGDCCAVVVRYFGGIKLGAGGLVRAYGGVVSKALDLARLDLVKPRVELFLDVPYAQESLVRHALDEIDGVVTAIEYQQQACLSIEIYEADKSAFMAHIKDISSGEACFHKTETS